MLSSIQSFALAHWVALVLFNLWIVGMVVLAFAMGMLGVFTAKQAREFETAAIVAFWPVLLVVLVLGTVLRPACALVVLAGIATRHHIQNSKA